MGRTWTTKRIREYFWLACWLIAVILIARFWLSPEPELWYLRFTVAFLVVYLFVVAIEWSGFLNKNREKIKRIEWRLDTLETRERRRTENEDQGL